MFSKACEYGIRAMIHIANESKKGKRASLKEIAEAIDSPVAFTAKILQSLAKDNLIISIKGSGGGYKITNKHAASITLYNIVTSIDGEHILKKCGLGLKECNETKPCPVHHQFKSIKKDLTEMLQLTTVINLTNELNSGITYLKI